ncbi:hypothetical protein GT646_05000 [Clostridium butyricum]|uniref:prenylated flavin chaperone LpdD n=1 Tax=Clostridium butyricum TaxID=1492 RepID=UPI00136D5B51|nr:hypothetical protein [Clostridium butyricum]MBS5983355.1 hypothetical protein [Clostridium butyricum]MZI80202.1 hypothetical protein [Clostridium butyricum]
MERTIVYEKNLSFSKISISVTKIGEDYNIILEGGENPHIGCTVLAIPRLSLTGDGSVSSTSSVLNVTGHKDEEVCRYVAEKICVNKNAVVVCCGGFHIDNITQDRIKEVINGVRELCEKIILKLI